MFLFSRWDNGSIAKFKYLPKVTGQITNEGKMQTASPNPISLLGLLSACTLSLSWCCYNPHNLSPHLRRLTYQVLANRWNILSLPHCWREHAVGKLLWIIVTFKLTEFIPKFSIHLLYDSTIPLLDIFPREKKPYIHTKTCTQMLITTLFVIAKIWKQSKCLFQMRKMN